MNKQNKEYLWNIIILVSIFCIVLSIMFLVFEMLESRDYCDSINGEYKIIKLQYTCDGELLFKTSNNGWLKESEILNFDIKFK